VFDYIALNRSNGRTERRRFYGGHDYLLLGQRDTTGTLEHRLPSRELGLAVVLIGYGEFVATDAR